MTMDKRERVARAICAEKCAFVGEPACYSVEGAWPNPSCSEPGCHAEAQAAIAALEPMDKPRVKPLVWVRCEGETAFVALTSVKTYRLKWVPEFDAWTLNERPYENVSIAKDAAQADYEARILAAL